MYILELYQNNYSKDLVAFDSLEEGREFVSKIPGYTVEKEDNIELHYLRRGLWRNTEKHSLGNIERTSIWKKKW